MGTRDGEEEVEEWATSCGNGVELGEGGCRAMFETARKVLCGISKTVASAMFFGGAGSLKFQTSTSACAHDTGAVTRGHVGNAAIQ